MRSSKMVTATPGPAPASPLPSRPQSLNEIVYAELRRQILWGEIAAGSTLSVRRLSEQFRVSPMPVRDAIRRLEHEDLVEVTPRSATRVSLVSPDAVREIAEVRSRLEALAARLAVPNLTSADIKRLRELLRAMQGAATRNDPEAWHQGNAEFHRVVIHRSGSRLLTRMTDGLWDRSIRHFSARVLSQAHFRRLRHKEHQAHRAGDRESRPGRGGASLARARIPVWSRNRRLPALARHEHRSPGRASRARSRRADRSGRETVDLAAPGHEPPCGHPPQAPPLTGPHRLESPN